MTTIPQPANHSAALYGRKWISGRFRVGGRGPSPRFTTGHTLRVSVFYGTIVGEKMTGVW